MRCVRNHALVHFDEDNKSQYKKMKPNELRVAVIGAQNLVDEGGVVTNRPAARCICGPSSLDKIARIPNTNLERGLHVPRAIFRYF